MIEEECPHCRVENLIVIDGAVWGYQSIRFSKVPPRANGDPRRRPAELTAGWQWFIHECQKLKNAIVPEVHFRDGSPAVLVGNKSDGLTISPLGGSRAEPQRALALA